MYLVDISFADLPAHITDKQALQVATEATTSAVKPHRVMIDLFYWCPSFVFDLHGQKMPGKRYLLIQHLEVPEASKV